MSVPYDSYGGLDFSFKSGASFSANIYKLAKLDTTTEGQVVLCSATTDAVLGVIQDDPSVSGTASSIRIQGISKVVVDGGAAAISVGDRLGPDTSGRGVKITHGANQLSFGIALQASSATGDIIAVLLTPGVYTS